MGDQQSGVASSGEKRRSLIVRWGLWLLALGLLWWAARDIEIVTIWQSVRRLSLFQLLILTMVNILVLFTLSSRWWVILSGLGHKVNYVSISAYRLAAFGLSYFTPGPQFGGEPLQIYLLRVRHDVPTTTGTASVTLEKVIELVGNFTFLLVGLTLIARLEFFQDRAGAGFIVLALLMLGLPLVLLSVIARGKHPFSGLMKRVPELVRKRIPRWSRWQNGALAVEVEMTIFFREKPVELIAAMAFSLLTWMMLVVEYWLMLHFLDLRLAFDETIAVLTTARLAFLTPLPGGLGALEAGQGFAFQRLGYSVAEGLSVGLLIRARDVVFGAVGLLLGSLLASSKVEEPD
jgi:uncharacterized protein (TIRG00374 family)